MTPEEILTDGVQGQADEKPQGSVAIVAAGMHASAVFQKKSHFFTGRRQGSISSPTSLQSISKRSAVTGPGFPVSITAMAPVKPSISLMIPASAPGLRHAPCIRPAPSGEDNPRDNPCEGSLFPYLTGDPVVFQRGNESGSGIKFLPSWLRMTVQVPAESVSGLPGSPPGCLNKK